jgi:heat shock protein HslJ
LSILTQKRHSFVVGFLAHSAGPETGVDLSMRSSLVFSNLAVVVALLDGSSMAKAGSELSELRGTYWRLDHIGGTATSNVIVRVTRSTIDFSAPCHSVPYPFHYDSGRLRVGGHAGEARSCQFAKWSDLFAKCGTRSCLFAKWSDLRSGSDAFEANLPRISRYSVNGDILTFLDLRDRPVMALARITANGLENRDWSIAQYSDGTNLVTPRENASIAFMNGRLDGSPGCGAMSGQYRLSGARLTVSYLWLLISGCCCTGDGQYRDVLSALSGDRIIQREGDKVILQDDQGATRIILKP